MIIGLGRQQEFHFAKYFKVLTLMSKCNETRTLPTVFAKTKIKLVIWGKKGEKIKIHTAQELRLEAIHLRSGL